MTILPCSNPGISVQVYGLTVPRLLAQLLVLVNRTALWAGRAPEPRENADSVVYRILGYINDHYSDDLTLDFLANEFFISKYHLSHTFTKEVGISLHRYITLRRLLMARQLLSAGMPAGQVSNACGFADYTSFYRAFKAEYGISPGAFGSE